MSINEHEQTNVNTDNLISLDNPIKLGANYNLEKYSKLASIISLRKAGLPTLPGFVVGEITEQVLVHLSNWATKTNSFRLSLRFDSPNPEDNKKLSLSNPTIAELWQMKDLIKPPIIGIVLAGNDRFNQKHNIVVQFLDDCLNCEVVGPGFDTSDLTRGRISPHEVIEIFRKDQSDYTPHLTLSDIKSREIKTGNYSNSRKIRYRFICSVLERGLGKDLLSDELTLDQVAKVDEFLQQRKTYIPQDYQPLEFERLQQIYRFVSELDTFREYYKKNYRIDVRNKVLPASFLTKHGLVFWDLYGADKYKKR